MKNWYEQRYVNHRDWILDNLELLGMEPRETVLVLCIDFMNEHQIPITIDSLAKKTDLSTDEVNTILSTLAAKKYLDIVVANGKVSFRLDGLFAADTAQEERALDSDLFDIFETEFHRTLSQKEMQMIADWNQVIDKKLILYALREASAYQKVGMNYIDRILRNWQENGITAEMIEEGRYSNDSGTDSRKS